MSRFEQFDRDTAYQLYVANSLQGIPQGKTMSKPLHEVLYPLKDTDTRSGDEIAMDIIQKAGLSFGG